MNISDLEYISFQQNCLYTTLGGGKLVFGREFVTSLLLCSISVRRSRWKSLLISEFLSLHKTEKKPNKNWKHNWPLKCYLVLSCLNNVNNIKKIKSPNLNGFAIQFIVKYILNCWVLNYHFKSFSLTQIIL